VNRESEELGQFLSRTPATLNLGARWIVLSYHSLEDRLVKRAFQELARGGGFRILTKHVERPAEQEVQDNPRSRSAKMRVIEKTGESMKPGGEDIDDEIDDDAIRSAEASAA
jgi:16S rRNA (cytosine1402-N4)-methyltransferase